MKWLNLSSYGAALLFVEDMFGGTYLSMAGASMNPDLVASLKRMGFTPKGYGEYGVQVALPEQVTDVEELLGRVAARLDESTVATRALADVYPALANRLHNETASTEDKEVASLLETFYLASEIEEGEAPEDGDEREDNAEQSGQPGAPIAGQRPSGAEVPENNQDEPDGSVIDGHGSSEDGGRSDPQGDRGGSEEPSQQTSTVGTNETPGPGDQPGPDEDAVGLHDSGDASLRGLTQEPAGQAEQQTEDEARNSASKTEASKSEPGQKVSDGKAGEEPETGSVSTGDPDIDALLDEQSEEAQREALARPRRVDEVEFPDSVLQEPGFGQDDRDHIPPVWESLARALGDDQPLTDKDVNRFVRQTYLSGAARVGGTGYELVKNKLIDIADRWRIDNTSPLSDEERATLGLSPVAERNSNVSTGEEAIRGLWEEDSAHHVSIRTARLLWSAATKAGLDSGSVYLHGGASSRLSVAKPDGLPVRMVQLPGNPIRARIAQKLHPEDVVIDGRTDERVIPAKMFDVSMTVAADRHDRRVPKDVALDVCGAPLVGEFSKHAFMKSVQVARHGGLVVGMGRAANLMEDPDWKEFMLRNCDVVAVEALSEVEAMAQRNDLSISDGEFRNKQYAQYRFQGVMVFRRRNEQRPAGEMKAAFDSFEERWSAAEDRLKSRLRRVFDAAGEQYILYTGDQRFNDLLNASINEANESLTQQIPQGLLTEQSTPSGAGFVTSRPRAESSRVSFERSFVRLTDAGAIGMVVDGLPEAIETEDRNRQIILDMISVREAMLKVLDVQLQTKDEGALVEAQTTLHQVYDHFVAAHGPFSLDEVQSVLREEAALPQLLGLEIYDPETKQATKSSLFNERVLGTPSLTESTDNPREAIKICMGLYGHIVPDVIANLCHRPWKEVHREIADQVFLDPLDGNWHTREQYLSGNVRAKLDTAQQSIRIDPRLFEGNVKELQQVQPNEIPFEDIEIELGAPWIPSDDISWFVVDLLGINKTDYEQRVINGKKGHLVTKERSSGAWIIGKKEDIGACRPDPAKLISFQTEKCEFRRLLESTLQNRAIQITDDVVIPPSRKKTKRLDPVETAQAQLLQETLKDRFRQWVAENPQRMQRLASVYNERVNAFNERTYDGSYLKFESMAASRELTPIQKDMVARGIEDHNTLCAHETGSGKTAIAAATMIEAVRMGLRRKPFYVVPGNVIGQAAAEIVRFYPMSKVLMGNHLSASRQDEIQRFLARARQGNWDLILVSTDSYRNLPISARGQLQLERYREMQSSDYSHEWGPRNRWTRTQEITDERRRALAQKAKEEEEHGILGIDDVGSTSIFVDEGQLFKNLPITTTMQILGLNTTGSQRAQDMFDKIELTRILHGPTASVVFLTATPICNTISEIYTMMTYVDPSVLRGMGIRNFDSWVKTFGKPKIRVEQNAAGNGHVLRERLDDFCNLPEMIMAFRQIADIKTEDEIPALRAAKPRMVTKQIVAPLNDFQKAFKKALAIRADTLADEKLRKKNPLWDSDAAIVISGDLNRAMTDIRLIHPDLDPGTVSRIAHAIDEIEMRYRRDSAKRGTQLVFMDVGLASKHVSIYKIMRDELERRGIPAKDMALANQFTDVSAWERAKSRFRKGTIRIMWGTTAKMGIGQNMQTRGTAAHHIDLPLRPDQYTQRCGRLPRAGNINEEVENIVYSTEGETRRLEILQSKISMIRKAMSNPRAAVRSYSEDTEETIAKMQEELTTDPLLRRKVVIEGELKSLDLQRRAHHRHVAIMTKAALQDKKTLDEMRENRPKLQKDAEAAKELIQRYIKAQEERRSLREQYDELDKAYRRQQRELESAARKTEREQEKTKKKAEKAALRDEKENQKNREPTDLLPGTPLDGFTPETGLSSELAAAPSELAGENGKPQELLTAPDPKMVPPKDHGFECRIKGKLYTSFEEAGQMIKKSFLDSMTYGINAAEIGSLGPFRIFLKKGRVDDGLFTIGVLELRGNYSCEIKLDTYDPRKVGMYLMTLSRWYVKEDESYESRFNELRARYEAEEAASNAPFEGEERYQTLVTENANVNAELMTRSSQQNQAEVMRELEPLRGKYMATTGRPLHPEELREWNLKVRAEKAAARAAAENGNLNAPDNQAEENDQRQAELEQAAREADDQYLRENPEARIG